MYPCFLFFVCRWAFRNLTPLREEEVHTEPDARRNGDDQQQHHQIQLPEKPNLSLLRLRRELVTIAAPTQVAPERAELRTEISKAKAEALQAEDEPVNSNGAHRRAYRNTHWPHTQTWVAISISDNNATINSEAQMQAN